MITKADRLTIFSEVDIYPVITEAFCAHRSSVEVCRRVLAGGAKIVQLREKHKSKREIVELAKQFRQLTWNAQALFIMNDHVEVALGVQADGVHLGQDDLPVAMARTIAPELLIGVSTHNLVEAKMAEVQGADYINLGPIFSTQTKINTVQPVGLEIIGSVQSCVQIPVTIMGGIKKGNLHQVLGCGARKIAMVTEITQAEDIENNVRCFKKTIRESIFKVKSAIADKKPTR